MVSVGLLKRQRPRPDVEQFSAAHPDRGCRKPFPGLCQCYLIILRAGQRWLFRHPTARRLWGSISGATRAQLRSATAEQVGPARSSGIGPISFPTRCPTFLDAICLGCSCGKPCQAMPAARGGVETNVPLTETDLRVAFCMPPYVVLACFRAHSPAHIVSCAALPEP